MRTKLSVILLAAICTLAVNTAWAQTTWYPTGLYGGNVVAVNQCSASTGAMYMASTGTGVYRSVDGGLTWSNISAQFGGRYVYCFYSFSPTFFTKATLAGTNDGLFRSDDDGLTWSAVTAIPAGTKCYSIATPGAAYIMVGTSNGIYVTGSYGYVWDHPAAPAASVYCFVTYTMSGQSTNFCGTSNGVYV
ncbi:MAG: hypothetical protein WCP21_16370, partial [Armatimonadota bacterium]